MSTEKRVCPVCNAVLDDNALSCPQCDFKLAGATQVFTVLTDDGGVPNDSSEETPSVPVLFCVKGPYAGEHFTMIDNLVTIGRDPSCSIFFNDMTVSREHCKLENRGDHWHLTDCGSLNGTWVDGAIVSEADIYDGSHIQIGTYVLVLHQNYTGEM